MSNISKSPLDLTKYDKYEIPQDYSAFVLNINNITEQKAEDLEFEYIQQGYKIFNSSLEHSTQGDFNLEMIIAKLAMIF